jgi:Xaa-Pro aminopeptidase
MALPASSVLADRHVLARRALGGLGLDGAVITCGANVRYLTNHGGSAGILVVLKEDLHLLIDSRYTEAVRALSQSPAACPQLRVWDVPGSYEEALIDCLANSGPLTIGFEAGHVTVARHDWWQNAITTRQLPIAFRRTERLIEQLRLVKDATEITTLRDAAARLTSVAAKVIDTMQAGTTERWVAGCLEQAMRDAGYERLAFDTIVASGPNGALPHHRAGARVLTRGDLVVLDFGGVLDGYCCDLTRTVSIGPPSEEARRVYKAVHEAQKAAIAAVRPGVLASSVDAAARAVLEGYGLGQAFGHGTGHGLGLDVHEEPRIGRPRPDTPPAALVPGMVFTIEPGAYLPGWGGVRIEDDVLVTEGGCEVLTHVPDHLLSIGQ